MSLKFFVQRYFSRKDINHSQKGFTLVEVLTALFVLTVGIVPIVAVGFSARRIAVSVEHNLVAAMLAQEGVEVVRAIRDTNWIASAPFDAGLADGEYEVVWNSTATMPYAGRFFSISPVGIYSYGAGTTTKFQRKISLNKGSAIDRSLKVTSTVFWNEHQSSKSVAIEDHLFNWR
ncbi:MAG: prepilin-type N-terminal cleavage/methylation domain-containing protein [Patescibacteria group bacterium]